MVDMILFPSSFFDITKVDEDLQKEYDAVLATGLFEVALFGYNQWFHEDKLIVKDAPKEEHLAVYRGWMMKPEPPRALMEKYRNLDSPYYTIDFAELEDGTWRIVETGDGEVFGLSDNQDYEQYFRALHQCFAYHFLPVLKRTGG